MESNQLRIGNLVKFNDKISEVIEVRKNLIRAEYLMDDGLLLHRPLVEIDRIDPIPLTEEWMLKFGFEKIEYSDERHGFGTEYNLKLNDDIFLNYSDDFSLAIYRNEKAMEDEVGILPKWEAIKHVHQLQNLIFALVGEEITLKQ
jgi:hypothetical protein